MNQQRESLAKANSVRAHNARIKASLRRQNYRTALTLAAAWLEDNAPCIASLKVEDLVTSIPYIKHSRSREVLWLAEIPRGERRVGALTQRQRQALATELRNWAARRQHRRRQEGAEAA
jgi:hypothetical protein